MLPTMVGVPSACDGCGRNVRQPIITNGAYGSIDELCTVCAVEAADLRRATRVVNRWMRELTGLRPEVLASVAS